MRLIAKLLNFVHSCFLHIITNNNVITITVHNNNPVSDIKNFNASNIKRQDSGM